MPGSQTSFFLEEIRKHILSGQHFFFKNTKTGYNLICIVCTLKCPCII